MLFTILQQADEGHAANNASSICRLGRWWFLATIQAGPVPAC